MEVTGHTYFSTVVCGLCRAYHVAERGVRVVRARPSCRVAEMYGVVSGYDHRQMPWVSFGRVASSGVRAGEACGALRQA
jgi:hypothetical protein